MKNLLAASLLAAVVFALLVSFYQTPMLRPAAVTVDNVTVLLDPGHGGEDGGTVAEDGTLEKNINLAISLCLRDLLTVCGYDVSMTRETDISIHDAGYTSTRDMKVSDMRNRLARYEQASLVIAIHQNHYSVAKYSGAQVFYSANRPESQQLAVAIQNRLIQELQPANNRQIKQATDAIYLLYHTQTPAVLVECGFLSNPEERSRLKTPAYQQAVAVTVFAGLTDFWGVRGTAEDQ